MVSTPPQQQTVLEGRRSSIAVVCVLWLMVVYVSFGEPFAENDAVEVCQANDTAVGADNTTSDNADNNNNGDVAGSPPASPFLDGWVPPVECRDFDIAAFQRRVVDENLRYVSSEPMKLGYGFTNQFMAYAGLVSWAFADDRIVVWPIAKTHFTTFVSTNKSRFVPSFRVASTCEAIVVNRMPTTLMKHPKFDKIRKTLSRGFIAQRPVAALRKMQAVMRLASSAIMFRTWDLYERWPFSCFQTVTLPWFFCSLHFNEAVEAQAEKVYLDLAKVALEHAAQRNPKYRGSAVLAEYLCIHLRMEPQDMIGMGRSWSNADQVAAFFRESVFPLARENGLSTVLVSSGWLHQSVETIIKEVALAEGMLVARKTDFNLTLPYEASHTFENRGFKNRPTNTYGAIFDLLLMERAKIVVLTSFSSFSATVYSRRCCRNFTALNAASFNESDSPFSAFGGGPQEGGIYVYDVYLDGTPTLLTPYPCGYAFADALRGATIPAAPPELFFTSKFDRLSPLFTNHSRNTGEIQYPPNAVAFKHKG